ncbi:hypothetical protein MMC26_007459 [Xylographa opegraphella]|nr:hypothetical protein [Xylographa opegraphella]
MALQPARDVPLLIRSVNASSERRISPSWSVAQLRAKLEPITGVPPSCQKLTLMVPGRDEIVIEAQDEEVTQVAHWNLQAYAEIHVKDLRPPSALTNLTDTSAVPKYTMPASTYARLPATVLAWKKSQKLGRFDPSLPEHEAQKIQSLWDEIGTRGIRPGRRCRLGSEDTRRGTVAFVGEVEEIPGKGPWIGVELDEPVGKNDGSVGGKRYFGCGERRGVFVRPERVEIGDCGLLMEEVDEDLEEL